LKYPLKKIPAFLLGLGNSSLAGVLRRGIHLGTCPICDKGTIFFKLGDWLRDDLRCIRCLSIPRQRAIIRVLNTRFPQWRDYRIHESSPCGASSEKLARDCRGYLPTHYYADALPGTVTRGFRCEDLEHQTFPDNTFDLVITQDVLEHLFDPAKALEEIARTIKPGGAHVFTVPWYSWKATDRRAEKHEGGIHHIREPEYHGNPIDSDGSLVVTEWGWELYDFIFENSGMATTAIDEMNPLLGIEGDFREVFISRKM